MAGERDDAKTDRPEGDAMRDVVRDAFLSGGVSLDRMIETFFETEDKR